jgi:glycosyltransferase involved in cell wall biosynthesis
MRKVLIISYYWPPAGGISVHRSLKFAKYLRKFDWEPIVYVPSKADYPYFDEGNFKDIPENLTILTHPIKEPFKLFKMVSGRGKDESLNNIVHVRTRKQSWIDKLGIWIRGNFFIPDARSLWIQPSVKYLSTYLKSNQIDAIFADGPPHTNNVIAMKLSKKYGIPYLADFQDPWTQVDYYDLFPLTSWADSKHKRLEQEVFRQASKITIASPSWKTDLEHIGAENVDVLYWGYDEDDFSDLEAIENPYFSIAHIGLMGFDRNPDLLFKVLGELKEEDQQFNQDLKIILVGQIDYSIKKKISEYNLDLNVEYHGIVDRIAALKIAKGSSLLLLLLNKAKNAKGRLPGKLYEYLRLRRPVLTLGLKNSDAEQIIDDTLSGESVEYDDTGKIRDFILDSYNRFKNNQLLQTTGDISFYSVENQTRRLAEFLSEISGKND